MSSADSRESARPPAEALEVSALLIGAGASGLCQAVHLQRIGVDFLILERESDVGGTWRDNAYPGAACDVPGYYYSFSFHQNPRWS